MSNRHQYDDFNINLSIRRLIDDSCWVINLLKNKIDCMFLKLYIPKRCALL